MFFLYYLGGTLLSWLTNAIKMAQRHRELHQEFSATFPSDVLSKWESMVQEWESNIKAPNPFEEPAIGNKSFSAFQFLI